MLKIMLDWRYYAQINGIDQKSTNSTLDFFSGIVYKEQKLKNLQPGANFILHGKETKLLSILIEKRFPSKGASAT